MTNLSSENMSDAEKIVKLTEKACSFCSREFSYDELFAFLKNGSDDEKQICILKIPCVKNQKDADLLLSHLTNQHGTVREAVAEKINELMKKESGSFFQTPYAMEKFLCAVNDVNPNICRMIIEILPFLCEKKDFLKSLYKKTQEVLNEAEILNVRNRSHLYTKKIFNLYWCLEAISQIVESADEDLKSIVEKTYCSEEYTVREKTAKILKKINSVDFKDYLFSLENDENFYVRFQANVR